MEKNQFFYQNDQLHLVLCGRESRTLLCYQGSPLAEENSQRAPGKTSLLASDMQSSVLSARATDKHNLSYDPYGNTPLTNQAYSLLAFNGQSRQAVTGLYLLGNGYRAYSPILRRFYSADSWSPFGAGGLNAYMYCAGDPVNRADPSGHISFQFFGRTHQATHYPGARSFMRNFIPPASPPARPAQLANRDSQALTFYQPPLGRVSYDLLENPTLPSPATGIAQSRASSSAVSSVARTHVPSVSSQVSRPALRKYKTWSELSKTERFATTNNTKAYENIWGAIKESRVYERNKTNYTDKQVAQFMFDKMYSDSQRHFKQPDDRPTFLRIRARAKSIRQRLS